MRHAMTILVLMLAAAAVATEAPPGSNDADYVPPIVPDELLLMDGTLLSGRLIEERADVIVFETASLGRLEIPRSQVKRMASDGERGGVITDPDYNSLMFCPTPATLEKGDGYFRDFELFFLNFGYALTDAFDLSVGTIFPISAEVAMIAVGGKLRLIDRSEREMGLALTGSFTKLEEMHFGAVGAVAGFGDRLRSLNLAVNRTFDDDGDAETVFIAGGDVQISRRSKLLLEYMSSAALLEDNDSDLKGFLNIGLRFFGETHSFSLTGFRPLSEDTGSFVAFPMIMYSNHW